MRLASLQLAVQAVNSATVESSTFHDAVVVALGVAPAGASVRAQPTY